MEYSVLGKTNLKVSKLGFGGIPIQRISCEQAKEVINTALSQGVNFVDTAKLYTVSESYIGKAINSDKEVILASKSPAINCNDMLNDIKLSLANLNTDYIHLYQAHNIRSVEAIDTIFGDNGAYQAFLQMKNEGHVGHFGIISHSVEVLMYALNTYSDMFDTVMYPFNIIESQGVEMFRLAKSLNIGTIAMKPLAGGNITNANLAIRYIVNHDFIDTIVIGMASLEEIEADIITDFSSLKLEEISQCSQIISSLKSNLCRRCGYCLPCPQGIDIPVVFTMHNYLLNYKLSEWATTRYKALKANASHCISCGKCQTNCPYNLPIITKLKKAAQDFGNLS